MSSRYKHLFFDLDHTLWDFETNSRETLHELYHHNNLQAKGIADFDAFFEQYNFHNNRLWDRYSKGFIKQDELRWKRMWLTLLEYKIADEPLSKQLSVQFLELLPTKTALFPYTNEILTYLKLKGYQLHLITNGFELVQRSKLAKSNLNSYFKQIITSEASNAVKPNKEIFDYAFLKAHTKAAESIMIGDNLDADIQGGINAGMDTIFVNHINATPHIKATYMVRDLKGLEGIF
ncbi:YjjG family noncanonical pyrimidine nucleotidase [Parasediminibacterium sp. JCM 36343]|uniref:YjjG family noncanonical pyrimidine nucleotidase n=1 Tax=Parasediminibacterium sp. JCM 36343 TaxID=3374279 RepID=UPI00397E3472